MTTIASATETPQSQFTSPNDSLDLLGAPSPIIDTMQAWETYLYHGGSMTQACKHATFVAALDIDHHDNGRSRFTNVFTTGAMFTREKWDVAHPDVNTFVGGNLRNLRIRVRLQHSAMVGVALEQVKRVVGRCPKVQRVDVEVVSESRDMAMTTAMLLREDCEQVTGMVVKVDAKTGSRHGGMERRARL